MNNLYIHIPFCRAKCYYCAFYSVTAQPQIERYIDAIIKEITLRNVPPPHTIYIGGGTPSLLGADGLCYLLSKLNAVLDLSNICEISIEANPASATQEFIKAAIKLGITRLSFGVQSFNDKTLQHIGRIHTATQAIEAISYAKKIGFQDVGFDLIASLPSVTKSEWQQTLDTAMALAPMHISVYDLVPEPTTPIGKCYNIDPDDAMDTIASTEDFLSKYGYSRYEISNYAQLGFECKHNLNVWHGEDYIGIGPSAASREKLTRITNAPDLSAYITSLSEGSLPPRTITTLSQKEDAEERFIHNLRLLEGVNPATFPHPQTSSLASHWGKKLRSLIPHNLVSLLPNGNFTLTRRGREVLDSIQELLIR